MSTHTVNRLIGHFYLTAAAWILALVVHPALGAPAAKEFTVKDAIEFNEIVDPRDPLADFYGTQFKYSPDQRAVAFVTRIGNLSSGSNEYSLQILKTHDIEAALSSRGPLRPVPLVVARMATSLPRHAIEHVRWTSDDRVAFVGRKDESAGQVYVYDLRSKALTQLTSSPADIVTFALSWASQLLIFSAGEMEHRDERARRGYTVRSEVVAELMSAESPITRLRHSVLDLRTGKVLPVGLPRAYVPREFSVSPDGRSAVVLAQVEPLPEGWNAYAPIGQFTSGDEGSGSARADDEFPSYDDAFNHPASWIQQYYLVDLVGGAASPLVNAPAIVYGISPRVIWSATGASVILPSTFLPLDRGNTREFERQRSTQGIVEVDLRTRAVSGVVDMLELAPSDRDYTFIKAIASCSDGSLEVVTRTYREQTDRTAWYSKVSGSWARTRSQRCSSEANHISLTIDEGMNTPPEIRAVDHRSGRSRLITELNPQLKDKALGNVEIFDWSDRTGRTFRGGLLVPSDYVKGRRYPVVLQTYGFRSEEFLLNGPYSIATAYAARPLAGKGFVVLQMPHLDVPKEGRRIDALDSEENHLFEIGLEAAVAALDERAVADTGRLGIIGFSREGMHVHNALTFGKVRFAAAVISDSVTATPLSYVLTFGFPRPGMMEWEEGGIIGAPLWDDGARVWFERSPLFHLNRIQTPLRLEAIGYGMPPLWETFAILKRQHRPVEMIHIPKDEHQLQTPWGRYTSQQGTVDWFAFWLNNQEDDDPRKATQYEYWRVLRHQRDKLLRSEAPAN